ncbi:endonuclease/exonuclease/phosphatase family [Spizellomyces punctatus DAOM BR117]|uniref:Endonuclease/exonuclease/phosphatase family n=1 Tax=Spizellomyces punctatus (strain DAOM BR117) TaxID=645134 RepID=A0A0L0HGF2_SPIPD|nr:endonuclease/exonuclease/phosphatase family [Spizellomyces punctatus DAOM BR117]KND00163.1 endonuclease/exonuclease/phosphatase family [Spizellomyces punctatus DAOM BR117]|eukprot:XP_016608202.1 endonuclease/exonuclease/phosphatase family [Spizellomyces punctatus DAOM BR117]
MDITIVSFNVRFGSANDGPNSWEFRRSLAYKTIDMLDPDILCLQEAELWQIRETLDGVSKKSYELVGVGREDGREAGEFSCILYDRAKFQLIRSGTFWLSETPDHPGPKGWGASCQRICTFAELERSGKRMAVFNTHLDNISRMARAKGIALVLDRVKGFGVPDVFVTGDFNNFEEDADEVVQMRRAGFMDTYELLHPNIWGKDRATFHDFTGSAIPPKIDFIWMRSPENRLKVVDADIVRHHGENGRYPSDHFPVMAKITG